MLGERVAGKYQLRKLLGQGSIGAVYEGVHLELGKRLAIKLMHPEFGESAEAVARFRREARAASAVESDYIEQIIDFGRDPRLGLYMVIEYLEGEDLEARLRRERWITEPETVTIGVQIARGLSKAHAAGIVHRDLKPANVFLTRRDDGSLLAKILDFGISKYDPERGASTNAEPTLTAIGVALGTPQYMSPEQCEGLTLDARTDVWSLCAVLYEMIAGEAAVPATGGHLPTMQRIVQKDVPPLARRADWVTPSLARVIDAGLRRDRDQRIADAATLASMLRKALPETTSRAVLSAPSAKTDVSELGGLTEAAPSNAAESSGRFAVAIPRLAPPSLPVVRETGRPRAQGDTSPPSSDEGVAIFRRGEPPPELAAPSEKNTKGDR